MQCGLLFPKYPCTIRACQSVGHATLVLGCIAVFVLIVFIFSFDLPGGDDVRGGPMTKYKLITTHFQVGALTCCEHRLHALQNEQ